MPIIYHYPAVLIIVALQYILKLYRVSHLTLFFFFSIVLAILCLLPFHTNFRIGLPYTKWFAEIFIEIAIGH